MHRAVHIIDWPLVHDDDGDGGAGARAMFCYMRDRGNRHSLVCGSARDRSPAGRAEYLLAGRESYSSSVVYSVVIRYCEGGWLEQEKCESMKLLIGNEMVADEVKINIARGR